MFPILFNKLILVIILISTLRFMRLSFLYYHYSIIEGFYYIFLNLYFIYYHFLKLFCHIMQHVGSQFPNQGSNPRPPAVEAQSLNYWTAREVPILLYFTFGCHHCDGLLICPFGQATVPSYSIKHQSRCCCEGISQM